MGFLKTIDLEEKFGGKTYQQNKSKEEKKKAANSKAAIGYVYQDSSQVADESAGESESDSEESDMDLDLSIDVMSLGTNQRTEINTLGMEYQMGKKDFVKFFVKDIEEVEELRM